MSEEKNKVRRTIVGHVVSSVHAAGHHAGSRLVEGMDNAHLCLLARGQPRQCEEEHQTHEPVPRPSSSASTSSAARSPSPSGGGASSGTPPLRVCAAIPARR